MKILITDPYVRVIGFPDAVQEASIKVRDDLQPHNKITMKLDVPWTCHSHIIGKSGNTIQPVVKRTGVSIHFPDGNKNSNESKSNQVSINSRGEDLCGLEEARSAIRDLTPLSFNFTLPANAPFMAFNDYDCSQFIDSVHNTYNVKVEIQYKEASDQTVILGSVKGTEWDSTRVMEATLLVLQSFCRDFASQISVQMTMEISQQFHACITNRNCEILKKITSATDTKIDFDYSLGQGKEQLQWCHLIITGSLKKVYSAKQKLIGSLPLVVMFDLMPNQSLDNLEIEQIMQTLDVNIMIKNKRMDGRRSIVLKGPERIASNIYEAWRMITKCERELPKVKVPTSYMLANAASPYMEMTKYSEMGSSSSFLNKNEPFHDINHRNVLLKVPTGNEGTAANTDLGHSTNTAEKHSPRQNSDLFQFKDFGSILDMIPDRRAPGCEKKQLECTQKRETTDYFSKKLQAAKMMKQPVSQTPRTPTSNWSGFGFSKSLPQFALKEQMKQENALRELNCWNPNSSGVSIDNSFNESQQNGQKAPVGNGIANVIESTPQMSASSYLDSFMYRPMISNEIAPSDLSILLTTLQLERYTDMFEFNNITMATFPKVTDQYLKDLGVDSFGHRRRILMAAMSVLQRQSQVDFHR